ncbi:MAG: hypothetical protein ABEJ31_13105 [Haloarculaceae archaeon]
MEIPDLVRTELGGEEISAGVGLGDEDLVCLAPSRTLLYRGEGLLSDESVEAFPHDVERLAVTDGRRKTKFELTYVDGTRSFSVPNSRARPVLELLMEGVLSAAGVSDDGESVRGAFRFSELALVVTDGRVVKHVGSAVWSEDYEVYPFADLTGLSFEESSVATEVVLEVGGRPQRIKTPNEQAHKVKQVLEEAAFEFVGVDSLEALNAAVGSEEPAATDESADDESGGLGTDIEIGAGIDPLVTDDDGGDDASAGSTASQAAAGRRDEPTSTGTDPGRQSAATESAETTSRGAGRGTADGAELDAVEAQLAELTATVERQNELLEKQQRTIQQLIEELRQGRA